MRYFTTSEPSSVRNGRGEGMEFQKMLPSTVCVCVHWGASQATCSRDGGRMLNNKGVVR
jgi:hypothetical protein